MSRRFTSRARRYSILQSKSAFNAVEIDLLSKRVQVNQCIWDKDLYVPVPLRDFALIRHIQSAGSRFRNSGEFDDG